jgi:hypothetical protein
MTRTSDDGREDGARRVVAGETGFAHAGAVVDNQSRNIVVTHDELGLSLNSKGEESRKI